MVAKTFFGADMHIILPASTDIYLTGGKSHDSEIRLGKYLIRNLVSGDCFMDVGAHYGYFSLLASALVGDTGSIFAFEPSSEAFEILTQNANNRTTLQIFQNAVSDVEEQITFYEFPNLYSEYNSTDQTQFENSEWFKEFKPKEKKIDAIQLDRFILDNDISPKVIKIDVEGAENKVIKGLIQYISTGSPHIIIEFLSNARGNDAHVEALHIMQTYNYYPCIIDSDGEMQAIKDVPAYLDKNNLESDNIVFTKGDSPH